MKKIATRLALLGTAALAACGKPDSGSNETSPVTANAATQAAGEQASQGAGEVYSANGDITAIAGNKVTISHGPVEAIGWPAMTMTFSVSSPESLSGLSVGDPVNFQFQEAGSDYVVTSISKAQ